VKYVIVFSVLLLCCAQVQERLALKECTFAFVSVRAYDFQFDRAKLDFTIRAKNPNQVDAVLDRLTYTLYVNEIDVFSGTTGEQIRIPAGKSTSFATTVTLTYAAIGAALIEAIKLEKAQYELEAHAHIGTVLGELSYPVTITFPEE
jgi:LEA14-like dessication related protein